MWARKFLADFSTQQFAISPAEAPDMVKKRNQLPPQCWLELLTHIINVSNKMVVD
jgi:hypothetical protein